MILKKEFKDIKIKTSGYSIEIKSKRGKSINVERVKEILDFISFTVSDSVMEITGLTVVGKYGSDFKKYLNEYKKENIRVFRDMKDPDKIKVDLRLVKTEKNEKGDKRYYFEGWVNGKKFEAVQSRIDGELTPAFIEKGAERLTDEEIEAVFKAIREW